MKARGWHRRALLVEEVRTYYGASLPRWTGCHRVTAAVKPGLSTVPCRVLTAAEADAAFARAGYELGGAPSWCDRLTVRVGGGEGPRDEDRLRGREKARLEEAARMLRDEIDAPDWPGGGRQERCR
jgi:hypothetical protein